MDSNKRGPDSIVETDSWRLYTWRELDMTVYLLTVTSDCDAKDFDAIDQHVPRGCEVVNEYESNIIRTGREYELTTLYLERRATAASPLSFAA